MTKITRFRDIPQFTREAGYAVDVGWDYLESHLRDATSGKSPLDLEPDFQRAHVWTEAQQIRYVEYVLRGGKSGRDLYFNCTGWMDDWEGPYVIVDGKQRLQAARRFLANEIPAFGSFRNEFKDKIRLNGPSFRWHVNNLETRAEVLRWYLDLNTAGTPHTEEETQKVQKMLLEEVVRA